MVNVQIIRSFTLGLYTIGVFVSVPFRLLGVNMRSDLLYALAVCAAIVALFQASDLSEDYSDSDVAWKMLLMISAVLACTILLYEADHPR